MAIVVELEGTDGRSLAEVSGWVHDGDLAVDQIEFDQAREVVVVRFEQEPLEKHPQLPQREFVRRSWWATEYRLPFLWCALEIRTATDCVMPWDTVDDAVPCTLLGVDWNSTRATVGVATTWGPIKVHVQHGMCAFV